MQKHLKLIDFLDMSDEGKAEWLDQFNEIGVTIIYQQIAHLRDGLRMVLITPMSEERRIVAKAEILTMEIGFNLDA